MRSRSMIRKQVCIESRHDQMLKRRANQRGVTEAELIREAFDNVEAGPSSRRRDIDATALKKALACHALPFCFASRKVSGPRVDERVAL